VYCIARRCIMYYNSAGRRSYRQSRPLSAPRFDGDHLLTEKSYPTTSYKDHGDSEPLPYIYPAASHSQHIISRNVSLCCLLYIIRILRQIYTQLYLSSTGATQYPFSPLFYFALKCQTSSCVCNPLQLRQENVIIKVTTNWKKDLSERLKWRSVYNK
jgi:hypothetical protein